MRILLWHVHGSWTTAFVQGGHEYVVPVVEGRGPDGRGRADTYPWPASVREATPEELADERPDVVLLQRPRDEELLRAWLGRRAGRDLPAIWVEHDAPQGRIADMRHPAADRDELLLVHVTHFNRLFWDAGTTPTRVIEHGVVDPGLRDAGELARAAVAVNEPVRRGRVTGTDIVTALRRRHPIDLFGMQTAELDGQDLPQAELHDAMARRRAYLHPYRWTSLGLALIEAMHLGMPVVALATTEAAETLPRDVGVVTNDLDALDAGLGRLLADADEARQRGLAARRFARERYALERFLAGWDDALEAVVA